MKAIVTISKGENGRYQANMDFYKDMKFGLYGEGDTVDATIDDFYVSFNDIKELFADEGKAFPDNLEFEFKYDIPSFQSY